MMTVMTSVTVARLDREGNPHLTKVEFVKETVKTFFINIDDDTQTSLLSRYGGIYISRINKSGKKYFVAKSQSDALFWLVGKISDRIKCEEKHLAQMKETRNRLARAAKSDVPLIPVK